MARGLSEIGEDYYRGLCTEYAAKRERICGALRKAGLTPFTPQGAYYVLADISRLPGKTGKERAMALLKATGVASVPGEAFFHKPEEGARLTRFSYAKPGDVLEEACRRLERLS